MEGNSNGGQETPTAAEALDHEPVVQMFSRPRAARVLVAMADSAIDLSGTEIAEKADISRNTWYNVKDMLLEYDLIKQTRQTGNAPMFEFNRHSDTGKAFLDFADELRAIHYEKNVAD